MPYFEENGWEALEGPAAAKAKRLFGQDMDWVKKFGRKSVFVRDTGVFRLRAVGPRGEVYQTKVFSPRDSDKWGRLLARAAGAGTLDVLRPSEQRGIYVDEIKAARTASQRVRAIAIKMSRTLEVEYPDRGGRVDWNRSRKHFVIGASDFRWSGQDVIVLNLKTGGTMRFSNPVPQRDREGDIVQWVLRGDRGLVGGGGKKIEMIIIND